MTFTFLKFLLFAEAGISNYLNQTEKYSIGGSTEGPIYSTIDATSEDLHSFTYAQHSSTTPYASTSIVPFANQTQVVPPSQPTAPALGSEQEDDGHWITQPGPSGAQYAQPERNSGRGRHLLVCASCFCQLTVCQLVGANFLTKDEMLHCLCFKLSLVRF